LKTFIAAFLLIGASAFAQDGPPEHKKHVRKTIAVDGAPVTQAEARATFTKTEKVIRGALRMPSVTPAVSFGGGSTPVTRAQVVKEMYRIYTLLRPRVKITPRAVVFDRSVLKMSDATAKADLNQLITMGAIARIGPLAVGPKNTLTVPEFGDAVGFFMAQMAQLTNQPSRKWTPILQDQGK